MIRLPRAESAVAILLGLATLVALVGHPTNTASSALGLGAPTDAESTALFCTGFTGGSGSAPAEVVFANTAATQRTIEVRTADSAGHSSTVSLVVPADGSTALVPSDFPGTEYYGLSAVVSGAGVAADVITVGEPSSVVPCPSSGTSSWSTAGLSTRVPADTTLELLNAGASTATVDVAGLDPSGFTAPLALQGIVVAPHGLTAVNLGSNLVNQSSLAVSVATARGSVVAAVVASSGGPQPWSTSCGGTAGSAAVADFAAVPTANGATSNLELANFTSDPESVTVAVGLPSYSVSPFSLEIPADAVANLEVSPSSRVPAGGPASLTVRSTGPITAALLAARSAGSSAVLVAPGVPARTQVLVESPGFVAERASVLDSGAEASLTWTSSANFGPGPVWPSEAARSTSTSSLDFTGTGLAWIEVRSSTPVVLGGLNRLVSLDADPGVASGAR